MFTFNVTVSVICRETYTNRQATPHGCLPSLLGDAGDKGIEIVYGEEENILYWAE
jgi:hypothetical protein